MPSPLSLPRAAGGVRRAPEMYLPKNSSSAFTNSSPTLSLPSRSLFTYTTRVSHRPAGIFIHQQQLLARQHRLVHREQRALFVDRACHRPHAELLAISFCPCTAKPADNATRRVRLRSQGIENEVRPWGTFLLLRSYGPPPTDTYDLPQKHAAAVLSDVLCFLGRTFRAADSADILPCSTLLRTIAGRTKLLPSISVR